MNHPSKNFMQYTGIFIIALFLLSACNNTSKEANPNKIERKHHLNIPEAGIQSMMEANTQKIIEGTDGSVVIMVGEITRRKVDITIKRDDKILDERIINENDKMTFDYEGNQYTLELHALKKPLLGAGKAEISIH